MLATRFALASIVLAACVAPRRAVAPVEGYESVAGELDRVIQHELESKAIPALSIALVDGDRIVWAAGFGLADPESGAPATVDTVWRVGSVSKLFTDIAIMQLVEQGELDLDQPVSTALASFAPENPFDGAITPRLLTGHRAGLVREPPVGNYFDPTEPTLAETVASLNATTLVAPSGTRTKYSNAGIAVLGAVLEESYHEPYVQLMRERVLAPIGIEDAGFAPTPQIEARLAHGRMWAYDGREFEAPTFQLGMAPAGSLYTSVMDLGQFLRVLFDGGAGPGGRVLGAETLATMMTPAQGPDGNPSRYGIGFAIDELDGHRRCGHGGAIYGFSTELSFLPEDRLGVVVACSMDVTNAVTSRIAAHALRLMLASRAGSELPHLALGEPVPHERAARIAGRYVSQSGDIAELVNHGERLTLEQGGLLANLRELDGALVVDDRHTFGKAVEEADGGALLIGGTRFEREAAAMPAECPARYRDLIGEYGWDQNTLFVRERDGKLEALIEWFWFDALTEIQPDVFALPDDRGLYPLERVTFERDDAGRVSALRLGEVRFARRPSTAAGETFHIAPVLPIEELRARALAAKKPIEAGPLREADLVELTKHVAGLTLDVRYATTNNFLGTAFYPEARAFMQRPAAEALADVQRELEPLGYGLRVFDAYRPWPITKMFWDGTPEDMHRFVADPSKGSRHNRGCAVDLTLVDLATGGPVEMPGVYDEFSARSYPEYPGGTSLQRWHRELLRTTMERHGFHVYEWEWWHFDFDGWREYPILDLPFDAIDKD
jgi:CubicO group peptidase (beta-lactamase class C family)/D-alanyl-D-alanine dipeptidase